VIILKGRKKKEQPFNECISIRVSKNQKEVLIKNKWIKDELKDIVRDYLESFVMKK
jgi:hypothetical protein